MPELLYGLIGYPLSHSFSKQYFEDKFRREARRHCRYELFPLQSVEELPGLLRRFPQLQGLNVTLPHKTTVISYADELDETASAVGAVNVLRIVNGRMIGYNTDVFGLEMSLMRWLPGTLPANLKALVLGTGGAARAVAFVLKKQNIPFRFISRNPIADAYTYEEITPGILAEHRLVINTTPLGMWPQTRSCPVLPYQAVTPRHYFYDLIYNPSETLFMKRAAQYGATVKNGLEMLYLQAEKSWEIWQTQS